MAKQQVRQKARIMHNPKIGVIHNPKEGAGAKKTPMSCVPMVVLAELGVAMLEGGIKYGRFNWRESEVVASTYFDAALRHLMAWWEGEDTDPDSGIPHIVKAMATLVVLRDAQRFGKCRDDRPPASTDWQAELNEVAMKIAERHAK